MRHGATAGSIAAMFSQHVNEYFDKHKTEYLVVRRSALPVLMSNLALKTGSKLPTLRITVRRHLRAYGIAVRYAKGLIEFKKIKPTKNPRY